MTTIASQITSLTVVYSTVYSDADQRKHQSSASLAFVWGIHRDRWIPHTKGQLRGKCFHLMTSSWRRVCAETNLYDISLVLGLLFLHSFMEHGAAQLVLQPYIGMLGNYQCVPVVNVVTERPERNGTTGETLWKHHNSDVIWVVIACQNTRDSHY